MTLLSNHNSRAVVTAIALYKTMNSQLSLIQLPKSIDLEGDTDQRYTPKKWIDPVIQVLGKIDLDPTADPTRQVPARWHFTEADDCRTLDWTISCDDFAPQTIFMNPPYSDSAPFLARLTEYLAENPEVIAITLTKEGAAFNHGTQLYFRDYCRALCLPNVRISFISPSGSMGSPNFDVVFGYWGNTRLLDKFNQVFKLYGWVLNA